jgi:hypothetical protein
MRYDRAGNQVMPTTSCAIAATRVGRSGQLLDLSHRLGHVQRVVISDRQLVGLEHACGATHRMQCIRRLIGPFAPGDPLGGRQRGVT